MQRQTPSGGLDGSKAGEIMTDDNSISYLTRLQNVVYATLEVLDCSARSIHADEDGCKVRGSRTIEPASGLWMR
ncbi:hypothetical protein IQ272_32185 [Chroococcidiopsidales cyanobacterium LEGE 13417]|nr:hypothetical protein [Chroococcidiopsidales cyanobacterium LEGE 13417]